jgi:hypothetical protein
LFDPLVASWSSSQPPSGVELEPKPPPEWKNPTTSEGVTAGVIDPVVHEFEFVADREFTWSTALDVGTPVNDDADAYVGFEVPESVTVIVLLDASADAEWADQTSPRLLPFVWPRSRAYVFPFVSAIDETVTLETWMKTRILLPAAAAADVVITMLDADPAAVSPIVVWSIARAISVHPIRDRS